MKRAVIITGNKYPCEDAGAIRQHATAKLIQELGYSVVVLGYGKATQNKLSEFDGVAYISFRPNSDNILVRMVYRAVSAARMFNYLKRNYKDVSLLLVTDTLESAFTKAKKFCKNKDVILIHDSVEWFSPEQFKNGEKAWSYRARDKINRIHVAKGWRVMAISSYLEEHFAKQCDKTVRIPVIMDIDSIECRTEIDKTGNKIKFAYVGSPGKKDYLKNIIEGFELLSDNLLEKVEFHVVGVNEQQLISMCDVKETSLKKLSGVIIAHGRLPHKEAIEFVRDADFSLLVRDDSLRYAKAGFPTKIVESLACGTPPICNLSSDLGMYLNENNAVIADDHYPQSVQRALEKALAMSETEREKMRVEARKQAETSFDYKNHVSEMARLIK